MITPAQLAWREAFCRLYEVRQPIVKLGHVMHWRAIVNALDASSPLDAEPALVTSGYFFQPHTTLPAGGESGQGASWMLTPVVRRQDDISSLLDRGFVELPWFIEAEYHLRENVDADLRTQLGGRRFRGLRRLVHRADELAEFQAFTGNDVKPDVLASFERLHRFNIARYGHPRNHFSAHILAGIASSVLAQQLCVFRFIERKTERVVQAALGMWHRDSATLDLLVQGIDHGQVPPTQNLYAAAIYRIYHWAARRGIRVINLGRGAVETKLNLGANHFHLLSNFLAPMRQGDVTRLATVRAATNEAGAIMAEELRRLITARGLADQVVVPKKAVLA